MDAPPRDDLRRARAARDAGLWRVSRLTGWAVAGAIALTVGLSEVAARALPGRSSAHAASQVQRSPQASQPAPSVADGQGSPALEAPEQAPQPSTESSGAVSGGS